jgi:hypothetical protein
MDIVQDCDSYINIPSSQTYRSFLLVEYISMVTNYCCCWKVLSVERWQETPFSSIL